METGIGGIMWASLVRLFEMIVGCVVLSAVIYLVCYLGIIVNPQVMKLCAVVSLVAYIIYTFVMSRRCCIEVGSYAVFYVSNIISFAMTFLIGALLAYFFGYSSDVFLWTMSLTTSVNIIIGDALSAIVVFGAFFALCFIVMLMSPTGLGEEMEIARQEMEYLDGFDDEYGGFDK